MWALGAQQGMPRARIGPLILVLAIGCEFEDEDPSVHDQVESEQPAVAGPGMVKGEPEGEGGHAGRGKPDSDSKQAPKVAAAAPPNRDAAGGSEGPDGPAAPEEPAEAAEDLADAADPVEHPEDRDEFDDGEFEDGE